MSDVDQWMMAATVNCEDCDFSVEANNAQGLAAQHADKYGHSLSGEIHYAYTAEPEGSNG